MKLIVGLGNPGTQYTYTRHNLGFLVMAAISQEFGISLRQGAGVKGLVGQGRIDEQQCSLLMPATFMNHSGVAVAQLVAKKGIDPLDVLVLCDDLSLPFGQMRLRPSGSAGGHNGLKSIIESLGTKDFARLRLGIGQPMADIETANYVLSNFTSAEKKLLPDFINNALEGVHSWVSQGVEVAMNKHNSKKEKTKGSLNE